VLGEAGVEQLLKSTIEASVSMGVVKKSEFERIIVDTTVQVRREVANIIVSPAHEAGDETGCCVSRSLPVHALPATAACEATGTKRRAFGPRLLPRGGGAICEHQCGWDARLSGMVNICELLQASL
jgi:IS5 family transposase